MAFRPDRGRGLGFARLTRGSIVVLWGSMAAKVACSDVTAVPVKRSFPRKPESRTDELAVDFRLNLLADFVSLRCRRAVPCQLVPDRDGTVRTDSLFGRERLGCGIHRSSALPTSGVTADAIMPSA